jgi:hypothetical protein
MLQQSVRKTDSFWHKKSPPDSQEGLNILIINQALLLTYLLPQYGMELAPCRW